jgi:phage terminase small subunit
VTAKAAPSARPLTAKQRRFADEYLIDLNATQAAARAGYSARTANEQGARLLANVSVRSAIETGNARRSERTGITADRVLEQLARIAFFDMRKLYRADGTLKAMHELDEDGAAVLSSVEVFEEFEGRGEDRVQVGFTKKVKLTDKVAAIGLAMRHLGMLKDKTELTGANGAPLLSGLTVEFVDGPAA